MRNKICWNDGWRFFRKDQPAADTLAAGEAVTLPHTWNAKDSRTAATTTTAEPAGTPSGLPNPNWPRASSSGWNLRARP